jgi:hypothetical protein
MERVVMWNIHVMLRTSVNEDNDSVVHWHFGYSNNVLHAREVNEIFHLIVQKHRSWSNDIYHDDS